MRAAVVRMTASLGPARGIGLSMIPTLPIVCMTKAFMVAGVGGIASSSNGGAPGALASGFPLRENGAADVLRRVVERSGYGLVRLSHLFCGVLDLHAGHFLAGLSAAAAQLSALVHHRVALGELVARVGTVVTNFHAFLADVGGMV